MKKLIFKSFLSLLLLQIIVYPQSWVQTGGTPQGSGVTDMLVREGNGWIYVTTGSFNWPSEPGGVRVSTDDGNTWLNQTTSYVARTIIEGTDGNLYASIWPDPSIFAADGLYRSTNNGAVWTPLGFVQAGDNIFSIATSPTTPVQTIFAGTRNGVIRSTDNGSTFQNTSIGLPLNSWVRSIAIKSDGSVYIASTNGVFRSTDNGNTWDATGGIDPADTSVIISVVNPWESAGNEAPVNEKTTVGTQNGKLYEEYEEGAFYFLVQFFNPNIGEISGLKAFVPLAMFAQYTSPGNSGGVYIFHGGSGELEAINEGLPGNRPISALELKQTRLSKTDLSTYANSINLNAYAGYFENAIGGAKIFKKSVTVGVKEIISNIPTDYVLKQNYPNPFNPNTTIEFSVPEETFVTLEIYNTLGEKISTLLSDELSAGTYKYEWNAFEYPSGIYFYKLTANEFSQTKKLMLIK